MYLYLRYQQITRQINSAPLLAAFIFDAALVAVFVWIMT